MRGRGSGGALEDVGRNGWSAAGTWGDVLSLPGVKTVSPRQQHPLRCAGGVMLCSPAVYRCWGGGATYMTDSQQEAFLISLVVIPLLSGGAGVP